MRIWKTPLPKHFLIRLVGLWGVVREGWRDRCSNVDRCGEERAEQKGQTGPFTGGSWFLPSPVVTCGLELWVAKALGSWSFHLRTVELLKPFNKSPIRIHSNPTIPNYHSKLGGSRLYFNCNLMLDSTVNYGPDAAELR